jgi:hypothetical protein
MRRVETWRRIKHSKRLSNTSNSGPKRITTVPGRILADDLYFNGPLDTFQRADDLIRAVNRLGPIAKEIRPRKIFPDGQNVCIVYDMVTVHPAGTVLITGSL